MPEPTTEQYIAAKHDNDLLARLIAKAELMKIEHPADWVQTNLIPLMQTQIAADNTIVTVYAYAKESRESYIAATPPAPGANLGAVTDVHLETAINAVLNPPAPEPEPTPEPETPDAEPIPEEAAS